MIKAIVEQPKRAARRPRCKACSKRFTTTHSQAIYCGNECKTAKKKSTHNTKRRIDPLQKAIKSRFFTILALEAKRAGTYQIFHGHTLESLSSLYDIYILRHEATGYSQNEGYHLSHIIPVKGHIQLGLFHPQNLVVAPSLLNQQHGVQHFGYGLGIPRKSLKAKYRIDPHTPLRDIRQGVINFLGHSLVADLVKAKKIKPSKFNQDKAWIECRLRDIPEHDTIRQSLASANTGAKMSSIRREFRALLDGELLGEGDKPFTIKTKTFTHLDILIKELERMAVYRPELAQVALDIPRINVASWDSLESILFNILHGQSVTIYSEELAAIKAKFEFSSVVSNQLPHTEVVTRVREGYVSILVSAQSANDAMPFNAEYSAPF